MRGIKQLINKAIGAKLVRVLNKKINAIIRRIPMNNKPEKRILVENLNLWKVIDKSHNTKWLKVYSAINGIADYNYISEITYYKEVEPRLNNVSFAEAYSDKNFYPLILNSDLMPKTYLRCINGVMYDDNYNVLDFDNEEEIKKIANQNGIVVKSSIETGGGRGVDVILKDSEKLSQFKKFNTIGELKNVYGQSFIVQEYMCQHPFFSQFNSTSVNTVRLFTYRSVVDEQIHVIQAVLRIGKKGSFVDNQASGGFCCGIDLQTAKLNSFAVNKYGEKFESVNSTSLLGDYFVPKFDDLLSVSKEIAKSYRYHRLLGFDLTVTEKGILKVIEINNKNNEINFYQMNNGSLFREYTQEIIEYCKNHSKGIKIDFNI